jgi:hypothetical protein
MNQAQRELFIKSRNLLKTRSIYTITISFDSGRKETYHMNQKRIRNIIIGAAIIALFPNIAFFILDYDLFLMEGLRLEPTLYIVSTIASAWSVGFKLTFDILTSKADKREKIASFIIFYLILPTVFILSLQKIIPVFVSTEMVARAGFSFIYGTSVLVGYDFIKPENLEKQDEERKNMLSDKINKIIVRMLIAFGFILIGIGIIQYTYKMGFTFNACH